VQRNVGPIDAAGRVLAGVVLVVLAGLVAAGTITVPVLSALALCLAALVVLIEGLTRRCLLYRILGIDRCPVD